MPNEGFHMHYWPELPVVKKIIALITITNAKKPSAIIVVHLDKNASMVRPLFLTDAYIEAKSCTAPKNTPPIRIQSNTGSHPKTAAWIGPLIGPAPAIDAN